MDNLLILNSQTTPLSWSPNKHHHYNNKNNKYKKKNLSKTLITKPPILKTKHQYLPSLHQPFAPLPNLQLQSNYDQTHGVPHFNGGNSLRRSEIVERFNENQRLMLLIEKLNRDGSNPVEMFIDDGDWIDDHFWVVIRFLKHASRFHDIPLVFDVWKSMDQSRINESNYKKIVALLSEEGLMDESVLALHEMKSYGLTPSLEIYNSIIHGFATMARFDDALFFLKELDELDLLPNTKTFNALIEAYGHYRMYDEISKCVRKMENSGVLLDHFTYNLLIKEFSRGGLLKRMERVYRSLRSRKMELQPSTLVAMLEVYTNFNLVEKMENIFMQVLKSRAQLSDDLIRKMACVYLENFMFSRLDELGLGLSTKTSSTDIVWCLRLLSHACLLNRSGMDLIIDKMEEGGGTWNINLVNIILLAYMKMENFKDLQNSFLEVQICEVKPDIVTLGILFDAISVGFEGIGHLNTWKQTGFLARTVEMNTDQLVLTAFGKGHFLQSFEEKYSSLDPKYRENETWNYEKVIDLVFQEHTDKQHEPMGIKQANQT